MAMINCHECRAEISSEARACPKCGAKVPRTKWWLWIPLALVGGFLMIGFLTPEYKKRAAQVRDICIAAQPLNQSECHRRYSEAIAEGMRLNLP